MKINTNKINKVFENLNNKNQIDGFLNQRDKESFSLIPFRFEPLGTANTTEAGMVDFNFDINSFTSYAKLITGLNNVVVKWDGAYNVFIDENAIRDLPDMEKYITKEYRVGREIKCNSYQENSGANTIPSPVDASFKQIEIMESIIVKTNERLNVEDLYKVYLIPEKKKWRWLYIPANGLTEFYDKNNAYIGAEITLMSVNSLWSTSGGAIEQFIQKSGPGEGYAFPRWNDQTKQIELDENRAKDLPIQAVQREYSGAAAFNTIFCYGRPTIQKDNNGVIENTFNPKILASRLLLPYRVQTPNISPINTKPSAETDYYLALESKPTMVEYYENWKKQFQYNYDLSTRTKYEGILELPAIADLEQTNPLDGGTHRYILWDNDFQININKSFNTRTNKLTGDTIDLNGNYTIPEILAHNSFITNHLITLPMNAETNTTWNLKDIPIIGGFLNTITLGIPIGWTNTKARVQMGTIMLLTPANLVKYGNQLLENPTKSVISFDLMQENKSNLIDNSGIAGMGSAIKLLLTDEFEKNGVRYNTLQLGQKLQDGTILKWDGSCKPVPPNNTAGYVIDALIDRTISKTDCRTVFFSSGYEAYQSTYKTKSKFTNEIRDWTNEIRFTSWKVDTGTIRFPEIIQQPTPPKVDTPLLEIDAMSYDIPKFFFNFQDDNIVQQYENYNKCWNERIWSRHGFKAIETNDVLTFPLRKKQLLTFEYDYSKYAPNINQLQISYDKLIFKYTRNVFEMRISDLVAGPRQFNLHNVRQAMSILTDTGTTTGAISKVYVYVGLFLEIDSISKPGTLIFNFFVDDNKIEYVGAGQESNRAVPGIYPYRESRYVTPNDLPIAGNQDLTKLRIEYIEINHNSYQQRYGFEAPIPGFIAPKFESNIFIIPKNSVK